MFLTVPFGYGDNAVFRFTVGQDPRFHLTRNWGLYPSILRASSSDANSRRRVAYKLSVLASCRSYLRRALPPPVARDRRNEGH
jgi:hypothetical protein